MWGKLPIRELTFGVKMFSHTKEPFLPTISANKQLICLKKMKKG